MLAKQAAAVLMYHRPVVMLPLHSGHGPVTEQCLTPLIRCRASLSSDFTVSFDN